MARARNAAAAPTENPAETKTGRSRSNENLRQFGKGTTGNPGGRPKGLARRTRELVGNDGETILLFWASVMSDPKEKTRERLEASKLLADRGWGKAPAFAPVEDGDPLELAEVETEELAARLDERLDELAARRAKPRTPAKPKG